MAGVGRARGRLPLLLWLAGTEPPACSHGAQSRECAAAFLLQRLGVTAGFLRSQKAGQLPDERRLAAGGAPRCPPSSGRRTRPVTDVQSGGLAGPGSLLPPPVQKAPGGSAPLKLGARRAAARGWGVASRCGTPSGGSGMFLPAPVAVPWSPRQRSPQAAAAPLGHRGLDFAEALLGRDVPEGATEAGAALGRRRNGGTP